MCSAKYAGVCIYYYLLRKVYVFTQFLLLIKAKTGNLGIFQGKQYFFFCYLIIITPEKYYASIN